MLLYKYSPIKDYYIDSLENKYFYCPHPSALNDPFDCYVPIKHEDREDFIQKWIDINTLSALNDDNICFPFLSVKDVKEAYNNGKFDSYVYKTLKDKDIECFHVYCLSTKELNPILWSIYADSGKGMCICYKAKDFSDETSKYYGLQIKKNTTNTDKYFTVKDSKTYLNVYEVIYSDERRIYNCIASQHIFASTQYDMIDEFSWNPLYTKSPIWKHESECRGIFRDNTPGNDNCELYYEDEVLDSITFGYNTKEKDILCIKDIVNNNYKNNSAIKFYKIELDFTTKSLKKVALT